MNGPGDPTVLEAASWRLASELVRRNPATLRLIRGHPGGGQSDCLWLLPRHGGPGDVRLNRDGALHVLQRFDGRPAEWPGATWHDYLDADPREFLGSLESAAGLPSPSTVPASTPRTLTLRVPAAIAATAFKTVHPIDIEPGYIDTSGYGGGPNPQLERFRATPTDLREPRADDFLEEPGSASGSSAATTRPSSRSSRTPAWRGLHTTTCPGTSSTSTPNPAGTCS